jgi:DNA-directed RNA polymerase
MGRKSTVDKLDPKVRSHIEKRLRENRLTLDELIADLQETYPAKDKPSRSALGRYRQSFESMVSKMREQETMARILVEELGENPDDRAGALMVQSLTTLVNQATFAAQEDEDIAIDDVRKLARAAKDVIQARRASLDERRQIEKDTRERLLKEQEGRLEEMRGQDGMSEQLENRIRNVLLGKA